LPGSAYLVSALLHNIARSLTLKVDVLGIILYSDDNKIVLSLADFPKA
jgi:hypothetical protein